MRREVSWAENSWRAAVAWGLSYLWPADVGCSFARYAKQAGTKWLKICLGCIDLLEQILSTRSLSELKNTENDWVTIFPILSKGFVFSLSSCLGSDSRPRPWRWRVSHQGWWNKELRGAYTLMTFQSAVSPGLYIFRFLTSWEKEAPY